MLSLLEVVREVSDECQRLTLIGHNPGLEDFCNWLCGARAVHGLRTGGVLMLELDVTSWAAVTQSTARLREYFYPAQIGAGKGCDCP